MKHLNTDAHRAACPSCQMEYDKQLPDAQYNTELRLMKRRAS